jgi:isoleucyl-tRNA synthetase
VHQLPADHVLVAAMDRVREVCSAALSLRKAGGLRARLPLASLTVVTDDPAAILPLTGIIADEVNVREVTVRGTSEASEADFGVSQRLTVNARAAGPRLGKDVQSAIKAARGGDWSIDAEGQVICGGIVLREGEYAVETAVAESGDGSQRAVTVLTGGGFVVLDTTITEELAAEGVANDLIRAVQQARREAGLHISDRITLTVAGAPEVFAALEVHQTRVLAQTLAEELVVAAQSDGLVPVSLGDGLSAAVGVNRRDG